MSEESRSGATPETSSTTDAAAGMVPDTARRRVLFVGLGAMGTPMVRQLAAAGHDLHLWDADASRVRALADELGVREAKGETGGESAAEVDTVILMLPDGAAVRAVLSGQGGGDGLLARLAPGTLVLDMGSSEPSGTVTLADRAASVGVDLVDAPVSGGVARATSGELSIMFGGAEGQLERARPLLQAVGTSVVRTGPVGSAHAMKALNNLLSAIGLTAASEVLSIGTRFGLDAHVMLDVLNNSTGRNQATEVKFARHVLSREFDSGFALDLMVKDVTTALGLAADTGTSVPLSALCLQACVGARRMLHDEDGGRPLDHTELARYVERNAGTRLE